MGNGITIGMEQAKNEQAKVGQILVKEFGLYGVTGPEKYEVVEVLDKDEFGFHMVKVKPLFETTKIQKILNKTFPITEFDIE